MKRLVLFELRKILTLRVWTAMLVVLGISCFYLVSFYPSSSGMNSILTVLKEEPELVKAHIGPIKPELAAKYAFRLQEGRAEDSVGTKEEKKERILQQKYASAAYQADLFKQKLADLREQKAQLASSGKEDTFTYKEKSKILAMLEKLEVPGFYITKDWEQAALLIGSSGPGSIFMALVVVLAVAPLFSGEVGSKMDPLLLSSRSGRRRIVLAKLQAALLFTIGWITLYYGVVVMVACLPFGFAGWNAPLNVFYLYDVSPYDLTQLQGFLLQYAVTLVGACGLLVLTALISAAFQSTLSCFGLAVSLVMLPVMSPPGWLGELTQMLPSNVMKSIALINNDKTYNLLGTPVLRLTFLVVLTCIMSLLVLLIIPSVFKRRLKV